MTHFVWVPIAAVTVIHDRQIARHGGASGLRDRALLEMGCARAMNLAAYADASLADVAASYAFGIAKAHAFVDGNKRIGHLAMEMFLVLNGHELDAGVDEQERIILGLAAGELSREEFAGWVRSSMRP